MPDELTLTFRNDHRIPEDKLMKFFQVVYVVLELIKKFLRCCVVIGYERCSRLRALPANIKQE
jgi:hypothetical protein